MTTRLSVYNDALLYCGERALASLTEEREPRRLLDQVWNNGGLDDCLEQGQWYFAMRTIRIDYDTALDPEYGYQRVFSKPDDWIITCSLCSDEYFQVPLLRYTDERGYWYADEDQLYVSYVSNDSNYGSDMSLWPNTFKEFVACHFASKIAWKLTGATDKIGFIKKEREKLLTEAKNKNLMALPTTFPAKGGWSQARNRFGSRDRGNRGSLIG